MKTNVYKEARISVYILALILVATLLFYIFASMFTSVGYRGLRESKAINTEIPCDDFTFVFDAGHGGEDPGAVDNGLLEKDLNLCIAKLLNGLFLSNGFQTAMTRTDDVLLYNIGEENRKKHYDLLNRKRFTEEIENAIFVSIHMNKFPAEYCRGMQIFYSKNHTFSKTIADSIQSSAQLLQDENRRTVKCGNDSIYLLKQLEVPAVLIECGFLSNESEARLLSDPEYQKALAITIYCGIVESLEKVNEN